MIAHRAGKRVLELGAGVGRPALAAALAIAPTPGAGGEHGRLHATFLAGLGCSHRCRVLFFQVKW